MDIVQSLLFPLSDSASALINIEQELALDLWQNQWYFFCTSQTILTFNGIFNQPKGSKLENVGQNMAVYMTIFVYYVKHSVQ